MRRCGWNVLQDALRRCWPLTGAVERPGRTSVDHLYATGELYQHQLQRQEMLPPDGGFGGQTGRPRP